MKKIYYLIFCILILFTTGCNKNTQKFTLDKKYYNIGEFIKVKSDDLLKLDNENYILYAYNNLFPKRCIHKFWKLDITFPT